jgi:hypothetical protein
MKIIGFLMVVGGVLLGLYVGIWLMFIGGIVGLVNIVQNVQNGVAIEALSVAINIAKIVFAGFVGGLSGYLIVMPGFYMMTK